MVVVQRERGYCRISKGASGTGAAGDGGRSLCGGAGGGYARQTPWVGSYQDPGSQAAFGDAANSAPPIDANAVSVISVFLIMIRLLHVWPSSGSVPPAWLSVIDATSASLSGR